MVSVTPESWLSDNFQRALMLNGLYYLKTRHKAKPYFLLGVGTVEMEGAGTGWMDLASNEKSFGYQAGSAFATTPPARDFPLVWSFQRSVRTPSSSILCNSA